MEKTSSPRTLYHCVSLSELIGFFILIWVTDLISNLSVRFLTYSSITYTEECKKSNTLNDTEHDRELKMEDVEVVMERMGMRSKGSENLDEQQIGFDGVVSMFEEEELSWEEVKEAFGVFDENCDGFIDAVELQSVLCKLGYGEGEDLDACQVMIERYDENGDGKIDFDEFSKFMESSFC